jgi:hypothetical protein
VTRIDPKTGAVKVVDTGINKPNGIALSNDGGTLAVSDCGGMHTWTFRVNKGGTVRDAAAVASTTGFARRDNCPRRSIPVPAERTASHRATAVALGAPARRPTCVPRIRCGGRPPFAVGNTQRRDASAVAGRFAPSRFASSAYRFADRVVTGSTISSDLRCSTQGRLSCRTLRT